MPPYSWSDDDDDSNSLKPVRRTFSPRQSNRPARPSQPKRVKPYTPPAPPNVCVVSCRFDTVVTFTPMAYAEKEKLLFAPLGGSKVHFFPSKREAKKAIWHTLQYYKNLGSTKANGSPYTDDDFQINVVGK